MSKVFIDKPAPAFQKKALVNGQFKDLSLGDFAGKWLVLFFYPLDLCVAFDVYFSLTPFTSTFVCPTEIIEFNRRLPDFKKLDCALVGCSVDSEFVHLAWSKTPRAKGGIGKIDFPLISDLSKTMSRDYGVLYNDEVALRGLFIIDPAQNVRQVTLNGLSVGRNVDEVLRLLDAYQFTDKHGEVCPINWKRGDETLVPSAEGISKYLAAKEGEYVAGLYAFVL